MSRIRTFIALAILTAMVFGLGSLPYFAAAAAEDGEHAFNGYLHFPEDMDSYAAFVRQSQDGAWLFTNPYDTSRPPASYVNTLWLAMGKLATLFSLSFAQVMTFMRLLAAILLVFGFYRLLIVMKLPPLLSLLGTGWFIFGSGFGWLGPWLGVQTPSPDTYTELFPWFQAMLVPHAGIAHGMLLLTLASVFLAFERDDWKQVGLAALGLAMLGSFRPYEMLVVVAVIALYAPAKAISTRRAGLLLRVAPWALVAALWAFYWRWLTTDAPGFAIWAERNAYPPPAFGIMALGLGLPLLGVVALGLGMAYRKRLTLAPAWIFAAMWLLAALGLMFGGLVDFAWRTCAAFATPLVLLALLGLTELKLSEKTVPTVMLALIALASYGSTQVVGQKIDEAITQDKYYFRPPEVVRAMDWLGARYPGSIVMTHGHIGLKLPAHGRLFAISGHKDMTRDFEQKLRDYHVFGNAHSPRQAAAILDRYQADTIFWGPLDRRFGRFDPALLPNWRQVYENGLVTIYRRR